MERKFIEKLSEEAKKGFEFVEANGGHTERFLELMDNPTNKEYPRFTEEEIEYLAKEDLVTFGAIYEDEANLYMSW